MRLGAGLAGGLLLIVGLAGCDKAQVAQLQSQVATITISVVGTDAELFNVWDLIEDADLDGVPDDGMVYLYCEAVPVPTGAPPRKISVEPPWQHSLRISVLRADSTEFEQITDDLYVDSLGNLTSYDDQVLSGNTVLKPNPFSFMGSFFRFSRPQQMTTVNRTVLLATGNPLNTLDPVQFGFGRGLCSVSDDLGPPSLAGGPQPFTFELGKGDTLKVEARKALTAPAELHDPAGNPLTLIEPVLLGRLAIDGINITSLGGTSSSAPAVGDGFSFFYSSR